MNLTKNIFVIKNSIIKANKKKVSDGSFLGRDCAAYLKMY